MTYEFLQHYWWFIVSLLGALLVFLMFVQGANSMVRSLGWTPEGRRLIVNSTGRKWEFTFTTLVTFGGAFFASFPLFYSTSFGGAYWLWMIILFTFVVQAVSYEFQNKLGNILGPGPFQWCLVLNGILGPLLLGGAVATFFEGSNFVVEKASLTSPLLVQGGGQAISHWANASHGLDALLNPWVLVLGLAVMFLARSLGTLYIINNVNDEAIRSRASVRLLGNAVPFVVLFVAYAVHLLLKDGYGWNIETGEITVVPHKYLNNFIEMWPLLIILLVGVGLVLSGIAMEAWRKNVNDNVNVNVNVNENENENENVNENDNVNENEKRNKNKKRQGIWPAGIGTVLTVLALLLCAGWNYTAYYPSTYDLQMSLTIDNSSSSEFTLRTMFYVSLLVPFVLAYIVYCWRKIDSRKIDREEIAADEEAY